MADAWNKRIDLPCILMILFNLSIYDILYIWMELNSSDVSLVTKQYIANLAKPIRPIM